MSKMGTISDRQAFQEQEQEAERKMRDLIVTLQDYCAPIKRQEVLDLVRQLVATNREVAIYVEAEAQAGRCVARNDAHVGLHVLAEVTGQWYECVITDLGQRSDANKCSLRFAHPEETRGLQIGWRKYSDLRPLTR